MSKKNQQVSKGIQELRTSLGNVMTDKMDAMEDEVIAKAIRKMLKEETQMKPKQKVH